MRTASSRPVAPRSAVCKGHVNVQLVGSEARPLTTTTGTVPALAFFGAAATVSWVALTKLVGCGTLATMTIESDVK
jgi:hypothetical protein